MQFQIDHIAGRGCANSAAKVIRRRRCQRRETEVLGACVRCQSIRRRGCAQGSRVFASPCDMTPTNQLKAVP